MAETFTAANFDAVRAYTTAQQLSQDQKDEEAIQFYQQAIAADPTFGRAYSGLAASLSDLGRTKDAEAMWAEALQRIDGMTPREKLRTRGGYYMQIDNDYPKAIETYQQLVKDYPADSAGHNNLAVALFSQLDFTGAFREGLKAIDIYPKSFKYRSNYALYAMYAGHIDKATETAQALIKDDPTFASAYLPLAMSALLTGNVAAAKDTYERAATAADYDGRSLAAIGLADIAILEGRFGDAVAQLPPAIQADDEAKNDFGAVAKLLALADAQKASGDIRGALATIARARARSDEDKVLVTEGLVAVAAARVDVARRVAQELSKRLPAHSRAYGRLVEAEIARTAGDYPAALDALETGRGLADLWLLRYYSGLVYLGSGRTTQALQEFELCQKRIGEATAMFLDDLPSYRYTAELPSLIARAKDARSENGATSSAR